jgi:ryanodine receptor 2
LDECQLNRTSVKSGLYFIFNPIKGRKWNVGAEQYGKIWQAGDIIGCMLDMIKKTI